MVRRGRASRESDGRGGRDRREPDGERRNHPSPWARPDSADAFIADPGGGRARTADDLAEALAEDFVRSATSGEYNGEPLGEVVPEEIGGPFVETDGQEEFAQDVDESNPPGATVEPLPRAVAALAHPPEAEQTLDEEED